MTPVRAGRPHHELNPMTETVRTLAFAGVAVTAAVAGFLAAAGSGAETAGFEQVGTPFYDDFGPLSEVGKFTVTAFDDATGEIRDFRIARDVETGAYGIAPYGYPAEAGEKLGETAAALASIERTALQSRREADWADLGVVDPASEDVGELEGRGLRVQLESTSGNPLSDLIIGDPVEGREGFYYVRAPRDKSTYIARVDLDLSARFADWIDPQALGVEAGDLRRLVIPDESVAPDAARLVRGGDPLTLQREESFGEWTADGLPDGKQIDQAKANELARTAAGLTIVGVRPKPDGLNPDLTVDPAVVRSQLQFDMIAQNIAGKGFSIVVTDDGGAQVVGGNGQLTVVSEAGVAYDLDFGELFTGTEHDVAVGDFGEKPKSLKTAESDEAEGDAADEPDDGTSQSRYLFVTARLDASVLGDEPVAPEPPPGDEAGDEPTEAGGEAETPRQRFEREQSEYRTARGEYDEKLAEAKETVADLNERFGDWYYVVDAEDAAELALTPDALIRDQPPELEPPGDAAAPTLSAPGDLPTLIPPRQSPPPADAEPAADAAARPALSAPKPNPPAPANAEIIPDTTESNADPTGGRGVLSAPKPAATAEPNATEGQADGNAATDPAAALREGGGGEPAADADAG